MKRRTFIRSGLSATGGLLLSFHMPVWGRQKPWETESDAQELNAWLAIEPDDSIIIRVAQSEMGQGVMTSLPMIVAEELEVDWRNVRAEYASANRSLREGGIYKTMSTGGSRAVRRSREYLQQAGAQARHKLLGAAAAIWKVPVTECRADYGRIYHDPTGKSINYGAIAGLASTVRVNEAVAIKKPESFGLLGLPKKKLDAPVKVNGSAVYGMDVRLPGMLYASVVHCPVLGGTLRNMKFNAIREMPGVKAAVRMKSSAAVIADYYWQARKAVERLPVEWEIGEDGKSFSENWKTEFISLLGKGGGVLVREAGEPERAMMEANKTIESHYTVPYLSHACLEPMNCTVHIQEGRIDVWAGVQNPDAALKRVAEATGLNTDQVYIHNCYLGGGFGRRSRLDFIDEAIEIAKQAGGRPVQMIWSREEDQRQGGYRPMSALSFKAGYDLDDNVVAFENHSVTPSILQQLSPEAVKGGVDRSSVEGLGDMPYQIANQEIRHTIKNTHLTTWFWRSVGNSQNAFAMECFVDEMAAASASKDPLQFRREYLSEHKHLLDVLEVLAQKSNWGRRMPRGSAQGMAIHESFGTVCAQVAEVSILDGRVKVDRVICVVDCGNLVNRLGAEEQVESGILFGLSAALYGKLTVENGRINEVNYDTYPVVRMADAPVIETHFALSGGDKWGGMGEPATPPIAPAVCNAVYKITGKRIRSLPLSDYHLTIA
ncbi:MAG: molybdopterin-dependent oxidoreductase [Gammaproteobacteria bacterium]|nr:molybdopterin-dependent oxidoreductase [Gammaproteobacteria bacterium]